MRKSDNARLKHCGIRFLRQRPTATTQAIAFAASARATWRASGRNSKGRYVGSSWGRYLRSINTLYELQRDAPESFVRLDALAHIRRGITTNCDDFFLVRRVSAEALVANPGGRAFRQRYGTERRRVEEGGVSIVRRSDGYAAAIESEYLHPIIKTARHVDRYAPRHLPQHVYAVVLPDSPSSSRLAKRYINAGEKEGWHRGPRCSQIRSAGGHWYVLRSGEVKPILFIKTMQYSPFVMWNDGAFLANQRLYEVEPVDDVDGEVLCAVLNSTVFAAERYAAARALGREAAIDVEVFTACRFLVPDVRRLPASQKRRLATLLSQLGDRRVGPFLEDALVEAGRAEALRYIETPDVGPDVWPAEFRDPTRQALAAAVLRAAGVAAADLPSTRKRLYNELLAHTRKLRRLEHEAQLNRQGAARGDSPCANTL